MDMNISEASLSSLIGEAAGDASGISVSGAGDVNGDGFDDILIGAWWNDENGADAGQTYLIFGKATGWSLDTSLSSSAASFIGEAAGDCSGISVSGAGDVNGDGFDDILIGAFYNDEGGSSAGQTYMIFGKSTGWGLDTSLSSSTASFIGEAAWDESGIPVSGAGDVNGDGFDDFLIGGWCNDEGGTDAGQTYLIFGKSTGWGLDTSLSSSTASFIGEAAEDQSGWSVSGAGDVNGDGFGDFLIGARFNDGGGDRAGEAYLIFGKATGWSLDTSLSSSAASFIGEAAGDESGYWVSEAGDVNGDGFDDFLIGGWCNDEGGADAGQTYLIFGKTTGWSLDTSLSSSAASFIGEAAGDKSGGSVSGAGDLNSDGFDDILIGAYFNDEGGTDAGQTYLILGKSTGWSIDTSLSSSAASFIGEAAGDLSGNSVSGAGDVNGDGFIDFLIPAVWKNEGGIKAGQTYLISGYGYTEPLEVYSVDLYSDTGFSTPSTVADIGDTIYVELKGLDSNESNMDTAVVNVTSRPGSFGLMRVGCKETGLNTGTYRGIFKVPLKTMYLDTLKFYSRKDPTKFDTLYIDYPFRPTSISSLNTFFDDQYSIEVDKVELGEKIYIEVKGTDANPITRDIALVNISTEYSIPIPYPLVLRETDIYTGIYRLDLQVLKTFIWLENIRLVSCEDPSFIANVKVDIPFRPTAIYSLKIYAYRAYSNEIDKAQWNETLYIEVVGQDANGLTKNRALVNITSDFTFQIPIVMPINETDIDTGVYRGEFRILNSTKLFENLTISSAEDPSKTARVMVCKLIELGPKEPVRIAYEDEEYYVQYSNLGYADEPIWKYKVECGWLTFDVNTLVLSGTPDNEDIGTVPVWFNLSDGNGHYDEQVYQIKVMNTVPRFLNSPVLEATEDIPYYVDFDSDDDGQGVVTWHMFTAAQWLSFAPSTGELSGIPRDSDIGWVDVTVSVDDGNNGWNSTTFNLTVLGLNDRPQITTTDIHSVVQGDRYYRDYEVFDPDVGDVHTWMLSSDATWLNLDVDTGVLEGTPGKWDVGIFLVNITVVDLTREKDSHEFELTVDNINDKPEFIQVPSDMNITHGELFSFDVEAVDPDPDSGLEYSVWTDPASEMDINRNTGEIDWVADASVFGTSKSNVLEVTIKASDGELFSLHIFELTIIPTEPPISTLVKPLKGAKTPSACTLLEWTGTDPENETIIYTVYIDPSESFVSGMRLECFKIEEVIGTDLNVTGLQTGSTYYWTVIPFDGCSRGICSDGVFSFKVNNAPTLKSVSDQKASTGSQVTIKVSGSDIDTEDRDSLRYYLYEAPEGMKINDETGRITWTPSSGQTGYHDVTVKFTDGIDTATVSFEVEVEKGAQQSMLIFLVVGALVVVIILLVVWMFVSKRKKPEEKEEKVDEEAEGIARDMEEHKKEMEWEEEHYRPGGSNIISEVPLSAVEAHAHDHDGRPKTYEELYGIRISSEE